MDNLVTNVTLNSKYRMVIERAASTKGVLGYKVEANGDDLITVTAEIRLMKINAEEIAGKTIEEGK
jgi:hypothetical protein